MQCQLSNFNKKFILCQSLSINLVSVLYTFSLDFWAQTYIKCPFLCPSFLWRCHGLLCPPPQLFKALPLQDPMTGKFIPHLFIKETQQNRCIALKDRCQCLQGRCNNEMLQWGVKSINLQLHSPSKPCSFTVTLAFLNPLPPKGLPFN